MTQDANANDDKVKEAVDKAFKENKKNNGSNPAIEVKRELAKQPGKNQVYVDSNGVQYRLVPVGATLVQKAMEKIPDPEIRTYTNPETGKEEANPGHPDYLRELKEVEEARAMAAMDTTMMFGVEILSGLSFEDTKWIDQAVFLGIMDKKDAEEAKKDEFTYEFYYKKYKLSDANTIKKLSSLSGVSPEAIAKAKDSFPSN